jgi:hypothetical protein
MQKKGGYPWPDVAVVTERARSSALSVLGPVASPKLACWQVNDVPTVPSRCLDRGGGSPPLALEAIDE